MPRKIDWSYHRNGCTTCGRTQDYLAAANLAAKEVTDARKDRRSASDALALAAEANDIYVAKGKSVVHLNMKKDQPDAETLTKLLVGPTGNLRAPTLRLGKTLVVGFNQEMYDELFK